MSPMFSFRRSLAVLCIAALLAAAVVPGLLLAAVLFVVAALLPLAPAAPLRWPRAESQAAPRFLRAALSLLRAPPVGLCLA